VVIVEGYMDAAMAHQHGYRNVVATLGTAVTDKHLRLLRRQVDEIVLALDADAAGQAATWRALQQADESLRVGVKPVVGANKRMQRAVPGHWTRLKILVLPGAKDPDELIRENPAVWPTLVADGMPVIDFVLQRLGGRHDLTTAQGKRAAADEMTEVLAGIADPIEQDHFINEVAALLGAKPDTIRGLLRRRSVPARSTTPSPTPASEVRGESLDDYMLALLMRLRSIDPASMPAEPEFLLSESRAVYRALSGPIPYELEPYAHRAHEKIADVERLSDQEFRMELDSTRREIIKERFHRQLKNISALGDDAEVRKLMGELNELARGLGAIEQPVERESAGSR
jgi:DNA primase